MLPTSEPQARAERISSDLLLAKMSAEHLLRHLTDALMVAEGQQKEDLRELAGRAFLLMEHVEAVTR